MRLQSQPDQLPLRYQGPLDCFRQSLRAEGIRGLYRGVSAPLFGAAIETSSLFFSYGIAQKTYLAMIKSSDDKTPLNLGALVICGGASGAFTSLLLTPTELVKCQMQVPLTPGSYRGASPLTVIASIYRHHGLSGFWHGQLGTLIRETGGSAAWFGSREWLSSLFRKYNHSTKAALDPEATKLPWAQRLFAGAAAGVSYNFIFYPADTIKSRMQTQEISETLNIKRTTFWTAGKGLWRQRGIRGLYQGCGITLFRAAPSSALIFTVYDELMDHFG